MIFCIYYTNIDNYSVKLLCNITNNFDNKNHLLMIGNKYD
jgi:hypothetical protein